MANDKLECGADICVLGVDLELSAKGYKRRPAKAKIPKWRAAILQALADDRLAPGAASKLAGRLAWGGSHLFNRLGRAMLRAIFDQKTRRDGRMSADLRRALAWWRHDLCAHGHEAQGCVVGAYMIPEGP